jgi:DNA-binding LytR/AlgR family response regulator
VAKPQDFNRLFEQFSQQLKPQSKSNRIKVSVGDSVKLIPLDEIICFEAEQKYTNVFTLDATYLIDQSLRELESVLPNGDFMRIHRKHIVNVNLIREIKRIEDRQCKLLLKVPFDKELIVSRNYVDNLLSI